MTNQPKQWGGRRIARPGKKIGRPALPEPKKRLTIYLSPQAIAILKQISASPSKAIETLANKENPK